MKPRVGVYLSEHMAARLAAAVQRPGTTKSALVESALDRFLGSDDDIGETASVERRLIGLSRQIEQLDRELRIVNEAVALHARFHLATTPQMPTSALRSACTLGSDRFDEFAAQVGRRVHLGTPLMRETMDRLSAPRSDFSAPDLGDGEPPEATSPGDDQSYRAPTGVDDASEHTAAVREDGSSGGFPGQAGGPLH